MVYLLEPDGPGPLVEDVWPSLFYSEERLPEMKRKINELKWAKKTFRKMLREADSLLDEEPVLADGRPGWRHDFYSPVSAEHLLFDSRRNGGFKDPITGTKSYSQDQYSAWVLLQHERTYRIMRSLSFLYRLTGKGQYLSWVIKGLDEAVRFFDNPPRNHERYGAIYFQPLYDAQIMLLLSNIYRLVGDQYQEDRRESIERVFESGSVSLLRYVKGARVHNITCYVSAAIGTLGIILGREDWIDMVLSEKDVGLRGLLGKGLRRREEKEPDGFWYEGTTFYHLYAMFPLISLFEMAKAKDIDGEELENMKRSLRVMFWALIRIAGPDFELPSLGDLGSSTINDLRRWHHLYEYGAGMLDSGLSGYLSAFLQSQQDRGMSALAFGPDDLSPPASPEFRGVMKDSGLAVLGSDSNDGDFRVLFKPGPHGGGHDHLDKLQVILNTFGSGIAPDIGTSGYSLRKFKKYCVSTLAHNTLMVDDANQDRVSDSDIRLGRDGCPVGIVRDAYPGVEMKRVVCLDPPHLYLEDSLRSEDSHIYSWIFHARGSLEMTGGENNASHNSSLPKDGIFSFLTERRSFGPLRKAEAFWHSSEGIDLSLRMSWDSDFEVITAKSPNNPLDGYLGTLIARGRAEKVGIKSVFTVSRDGN